MKANNSMFSVAYVMNYPNQLCHHVHVIFQAYDLHDSPMVGILFASVIGLPTGQSVLWIVSNTNPVIGAISIYFDEYIAHVKLPGIYVLQATQSRFKLCSMHLPI